MTIMKSSVGADWRSLLLLACIVGIIQLPKACFLALDIGIDIGAGAYRGKKNKKSWFCYIVAF